MKINEIVTEAISRRDFIKGMAGVGAAAAAGDADAIAGAFPSPSTRQKWADDAAASNRAMAAQEAERQRQANAAKAAKLDRDTKDVERLNKVSYHGKDAPKPSNAEWDGDSDFLYMDDTQYAKASRMPISGDEPSDMKLIATKEGRQVYIWTRRSLKGVQGHYFYPAEKPKTINEFDSTGFDGGKPPKVPRKKDDDPWGNDDRSKILQSVKQLLLAGNKVDWKVPGQMGHVVRVSDHSVILKRWNKPYSKINYSLPLTDDRDDEYVIRMVGPKHYKVVSSDNSWNL